MSKVARPEGGGGKLVSKLAVACGALSFVWLLWLQGRFVGYEGGLVLLRLSMLLNSGALLLGLLESLANRRWWWAAAVATVNGGFLILVVIVPLVAGLFNT
jgi:hypothetical protein